MAEDLIAVVALTMMEIVLGIDNVVFIVILTGRLPEHRQKAGRRVGLLAAMVMRIVLLCFLKAILGLTSSLFHFSKIGWVGKWTLVSPWLAAHPEFDAVSVRDVILIVGGLFLIGKSVFEIHDKLEGSNGERPASDQPSFASVIIQIMVLDLVFSLDSLITAVGMADHLWVMITAVVIAVLVMMIFSEHISKFIQENPTLKMLALSFLILIGVTLVAEGIDVGMNKGYIYFAMAFSLAVEFLNIRVRRKRARTARSRK